MELSGDHQYSLKLILNINSSGIIQLHDLYNISSLIHNNTYLQQKYIHVFCNRNIFSVLPVIGCTALDNLCKWYLKIWPNLLHK